MMYLLPAALCKIASFCKAGEVMGRPTTLLSVFAAFLKNMHFKATASTMPKSTMGTNGNRTYS
eukprot:365114-Chlamydomonas_euryale.AAC.6